MKILCCCLRAKFLTGSEMYFYDLSDALSELGHQVTLASPEISELFINKVGNKFNLINIEDLKENDFDLIIMSHYESVYPYVLNIMPNTKIVNIIHSEFYDSEKPLIRNQVVKYVGIRQSICDKIKNMFGVPENKIELIRNPIDLTRFNTENCKDEKFGLFVGTLGGLRMKPLQHFNQFCQVNNLKSVYISAEGHTLPFFNVNLPSTDNIEEYFKSCTFAGGIVQGRTYWEAKLCGKKTIEYYINLQGKLCDIKYEDEPTQDELMRLEQQFDRFNVANKIISL